MLLRRTGDGFGSERQVAAAFARDADYPRLIVQLDAAGSNESLDVLFQDQTGSYSWEADYVPLPLNEWTHFIVTFDDATDLAKVYVNGGTPATHDLSSAGLDYDNLANNDVTLFKTRSSESANRRFDGDISFARFYDFVLSDAQAAANHEALTSRLELNLAVAGSDLVFTWDSRDGMSYDLLSDTGLTDAPETWAPYVDIYTVTHRGIRADVSGTNTVTVPRDPGDSERLFVVREYPSPPVVGTQKQLLVDDYVVAEMQNVTRETGEATKLGIVMAPTLVYPRGTTRLSHAP